MLPFDDVIIRYSDRYVYMTAYQDSSPSNGYQIISCSSTNDVWISDIHVCVCVCVYTGPIWEDIAVSTYDLSVIVLYRNLHNASHYTRAVLHNDIFFN